MLRESKARRGIQRLVIRLALGSGLSRRRGQGERHRLEGRRVGGAVWLAVQLTFLMSFDGLLLYDPQVDFQSLGCPSACRILKIQKVFVSCSSRILPDCR